MDAFDLDIEQRAGIEDDTAILLYQSGKAGFVDLMGFIPLRPECRIVCIRGKPLKLGEVGDPVFADLFGDQLA